MKRHSVRQFALVLGLLSTWLAIVSQIEAASGSPRSGDTSTTAASPPTQVTAPPAAGPLTPELRIKELEDWRKKLDEDTAFLHGEVAAARSQLGAREEGQATLQKRLAGLERQLGLLWWLASAALLVGLGVTTLVLLRRRDTSEAKDSVEKPPRQVTFPKAPSGSSASDPDTESAAADSANTTPKRPAEAGPPRPFTRPHEQPEALTDTAPIVRTLIDLQLAVPSLAELMPDSRRRESFRMLFEEPLGVRIRRFQERAVAGTAAQREGWIEHDLVPTLNLLAQALSQALDDRRAGLQGSLELARQLQHWLYDRLGPACAEHGWFQLEPVLPYTTRFDPSLHHSLGSREVEGGASNLIVALRAIGRRDLQGRHSTHKAEVYVGR